ncbi:MAG: DUF721 domain-containing protein [Cyanobacteria bacterium P01_F01_bin.86]
MALEGLKELIQGLESQDSWQTQRQFRLVLQHWPKAVGFAVARKTRPIGIQRNTLYVATATAAWANTLSYERLNILKKINQNQRNHLKNIRFSTAQWSSKSPSPQANVANAQHPSYVGQVPTLPKSPEQTPTEAFGRWASTIQKMQSHQAMCPRCKCHCPQGELDRWAVCALCATKQWQYTPGDRES